MTIKIVCNSRAERGPLQSVIDILPEAEVISFDATGMAVAQATSMAIRYFTERLAGASLVVVLGDRYETLAAALAAYLQRIPIAHIHGGEVTTGAMDNAFRDMITRMATVHFAATHKAAVRINTLSNFPDTVLHNPNVLEVGAPGLDGVAENSLDRTYRYKKILAAFYPETLSDDYGVARCTAMLNALHIYCGEYDVLFASMNTDPGAERIYELISKFVAHHADSKIINVTHQRYIWLMQHSALCIGNSSAFVIESPWVGLPTVLIGNRQEGRELAPSVIPTDGSSVEQAIEYALNTKQPYEPIYVGGAAPKIRAVLASLGYVKELAA